MATLESKTRLIQSWAGAPVDGDYGNVTADAILLRAGITSAAAMPPLAAVPQAGPVTQVTEKTMLEIIEHEGIILEMYKDSVGVETWGVGVTDKSGHDVTRYKDNPSTLQRALEVYEWLLRTRYLPAVLAAFKPYPLTEHELAAALSFHWNTGRIGSADWVQSAKAGKKDQAKREFMNWSSPREIIGRRKCERDLFFDGRWTSDGMVTIYQRVRKPSYTPDWGSAKQVDIRADLRAAIEAAG